MDPDPPYRMSTDVDLGCALHTASHPVGCLMSDHGIRQDHIFSFTHLGGRLDMIYLKLDCDSGFACAEKVPGCPG